VTTVIPSGNEVPLVCVEVTVALQLSLTVGSTQVAIAVQLLPVADNCIAPGPFVIIGLLVSVEVICCVQAAEPVGTVAFQVLCMTNAPVQGPVDMVASVKVTVGAGQELLAIVAAAVPVVAGLKSPPGQTVAACGQVIFGAVQQLPVTVTLNSQVFSFPH
jgi:hypothetical protein